MKNVVISAKNDVAALRYQEYARVINVDEEVNFEGWAEVDSVYLRLHFCHENMDEIRERVDGVLRRFENAYFINGVERFDDLLRLENKWSLAKMLEGYMPRAYSLEEVPRGATGLVYKQRLSRCGHNTKFDAHESLDPEEYFAQERMVVLEELRVYIVLGEIVELAAIRTTKMETQKVKMVGVRALDEVEKNFVREVIARLPRADFVGLDIARVAAGYKVIEVNWTPVFSAYRRMTNIDLAGRLYGSLERKINANRGIVKL